MKISAFIFLLLLGITACSKDTPTTPGGGSGSGSGSGSGGSTSFALSADWEDRTYNFGEAVEALLTVRASNAGSEQFLLDAEIVGGTATVTVEGVELTPGQLLPVDYQIVNTGGSSATLHVVVTPEANIAAAYTLSVRLRVCTPDGGAAAEHLLEVDLSNSAQIETSVSKDRDPLEGQQVMGITLSASKMGFSGKFTTTPLISEGDGYFTLGDSTIHSGDTFELSAGESLLLQYQPTAFGKHKILLTVADGVTTAEVSVMCEVYSTDALVYPKDGVYIYAKCYDRSPYFTTKEWAALDKGSEPEAIGVAIFSHTAYNLQFLIAKHSFSNVTICGEDDNLKLIPEFVAAPNYVADYTYQGKENTKRMIDAAAAGIISSAEAAQLCYNYDPENPGRWYLPSSGQLYYITRKFGDVQTALRQIGCDHLSKNISYLTSTGFGYPSDALWQRVVHLSVSANTSCSLGYAWIFHTHSAFPVMDL